MVNGDFQSLKTSVDEFKSNITCEMTEIKAQLSENTQRIENTEDDIQRLKRSQDLRLTGFPPKENENLLEYLKQIAKEIAYDSFSETHVLLMERIPVKNKTTGQMMQSNTIIIQFTALRHKQQFYIHYLNKMPLDPTKFNLAEDNRIVIGENLTKQNAQLFKKAHVLKKNNEIAQVFTEDGAVKIRLKKGSKEPLHTIRNNIALDTLVAQHKLSQAEDEHTQKKPTDNNNPPHAQGTPSNTANKPHQQQHELIEIDT